MTPVEANSVTPSNQHPKPSKTVLLSVALLGAIVSGCNWVAVTYNAIGYPVIEKGETANVAVSGSTVYATLAEDGFLVKNLEVGGDSMVIPPAPGSESVDDLAVADGFLFLLDARGPGFLSVMSIAEPGSPKLVSGPVPVMVGPFSGVSAASGVVVVSGGTSLLSLHRYNAAGHLAPDPDTIDLGRGQPDVLVAPDGRMAYVSTHYIGPYFGITGLTIGAGPGSLTKGEDLELNTYGFTEGGSKPANFPIEAALSGDILYVAHAAGLAVISVINPDEPRLLNVVDVGIEAVNVDAQGDLAAVVGSSPEPRLILLDIADPAAPVVRESIALPAGSDPSSVVIGPSQIVVSMPRMGLFIQPQHNRS